MGPYGSVGAHIKIGRSPMAQDHFQTPPDPQKGYNNPIWVYFWLFVAEKVSMILDGVHFSNL